MFGLNIIFGLGGAFFQFSFDVMLHIIQREKQKNNTKVFCARKSNREDEILKTCE